MDYRDFIEELRAFADKHGMVVGGGGHGGTGVVKVIFRPKPEEKPQGH